jgi:hypothetical protein
MYKERDAAKARGQIYQTVEFASQPVTRAQQRVAAIAAQVARSPCNVSNQ